MNGNGWWKTTAVGLGGAIVGLLGFLFLQGREVVSAAQVSRMIQTESPYVADKGKIEERALYTARSLDQVASDQREILRELAELRSEMKGLAGQVSGLAESVQTGRPRR